MATHIRQSKFHWNFSFFVFVTLAIGSVTQAADIAPSDYSPISGDSFFLLAESNFTTDSVATVRLETPSRERVFGQNSGVDIAVYRIPEPLEFLKKQKNLHRIEVKGTYRGEGISNALRYVWDTLYKKSRLVWQDLFSSQVRQKVVAAAPELKQTPPYSYETEFEHNPQFEKLAGFELVSNFRYPVHIAKPATPPGDTRLEGSSSNFTFPQGNVQIPLGKQKPGLYLVEAMVGRHRATTLVFVADTVAVTKTSADQMLVWTANKKNGQPVSDVALLLKDGVGTLQSGSSDKDGIWQIARKNPERSYVLGRDEQGGVFISENFYYDATENASKIYTFTDRPLYRPGEWVHVKVLGRNFRNALSSTAIDAASVKLVVTDPSGSPIVTQSLKLNGQLGADSRFRLPATALSGGYSLSLHYQGGIYNAAFRVAQFTTPHYEINIALGKKSYNTGEPIKGRLVLTYPSGKPVKNAKVELSVRSQHMSMVDGEMEYLGMFPLELQRSELRIDKNGVATFELPAAKDPSRYLLNISSEDQAAFRVTAKKEILIQSGLAQYGLYTAKNLTEPGEVVSYELKEKAAGPVQGNRPARWELIRLEDRGVVHGTIDGEKSEFAIRFDQPGNYSLYVRDNTGNIVGSASHWVAGSGMKTTPGSINIILDKEEYIVGEKANVLINFAEPVNEALLTLERDQVENHGLLSDTQPWIKLEKMSDRQWRAEIPIKESFAPNITFSVLYVKNGNYIFQNKGLKVPAPAVQITFRPRKQEYQPGEKVLVDVQTTLKGKPAASNLTISVVDEMIYVLQPEIAPGIQEFFYHLRRNQVRTTSSLNFHSYDMAYAVSGMSAKRAQAERALKMLERPRRDDVETALWLPNLQTDSEGKAQFSFIMPDSLTRWRITGRAVSEGGQVGQKQGYVISSKDVYLKWTGPTIFRHGDQPRIGLLAFNQGRESQRVNVSASGMGIKSDNPVTLTPGANHIDLPYTVLQSGTIEVRLSAGDQTLDYLQTAVTVVPAGWKGTHSKLLPLQRPSTPLALPPGASNVRMKLAQDMSEAYMDTLDDLIEYPYGCIEQTSSRLIPLAIAVQRMAQLGLSPETVGTLQTQLSNHRTRLVQMAGPNATFGWWGDMTGEDPFMTAYAYYADWRAGNVMGIQLPAEHWKKLLEVYRVGAGQMPLLNRVLAVWMAGEIGLPTKTLTQGLLTQVSNAAVNNKGTTVTDREISHLLAASADPVNIDMAVLLTSHLAKQAKLSLAPDFNHLVGEAQSRLNANHAPLPQAIALMASAESGLTPEERQRAASLLNDLELDMPTIDRALTLVFLDKIWQWQQQSQRVDLKPGSQWRQVKSELGAALWRLNDNAGLNPTIELNHPAASGVRAQVIYDSYNKEKSGLPVTIKRKLYRLSATKEQGSYTATLVTDWRVNSQELYVDEIEITPQTGKSYRYGLLEVPLPPGSDVESTTWNMNVAGLGRSRGPQEMSKARHNMGERSYSIALDNLKQPMVIRHLVRFAQRGRFNLPMTRYFRMYQPTQKAFESANETEFRQLAVE